MTHVHIRPWSVALVCTGLLLWTVVGGADESQPFLPTHRGRQHFDEVERISRNHNLGEYRGGELTLRPYIQLGDHNYLGLDETGQLMQVLETPERTIGFLMSGARRLVDLFYVNDETLVAIDADGEVLRFDRERWEHNPRATIRKRLLASLGLTSLTAGATAVYAALEWQMPWIDVLVPGIPVGVGLLLQHGLLYAMAVGEENNDTDGFVNVGYRVDQYNSAERLNVGADDYLLHSNEAPVSLREILRVSSAGPSHLFAASCEKELARGYPIQMPYSEEPKSNARPKLMGRRE